MRRLGALAGAAALLVAAARIALAAPETVASDGHPTNPVWYHDTTAVQVGSMLYLGWNTNAGSVQARAFNRSTGQFSGGAVTVSKTILNCGCTDSSGSNPNRHDVPALFADPVGRVYALYGGGTASHSGSDTGPYFRAASKLDSIGSWGTEHRLSIPGAAYDFEVVRDNHGVNHIIGQQGNNSGGAGSLVYMRLSPGTSSTPGTLQTAHTLVQGGYDSTACAWQTVPGCNVYVIGRIAVGPKNSKSSTTPAPLYVTWGWSEGGLSSTCSDPAGFCNRGLYMAVSYDGGATWDNVAKTASVKISSGPIAYNDTRYQIVAPSTDVGVYKAISVTGSYPGTPWIAYQEGSDLGTGVLKVTHRSGSSWVTQTVDASRSWNNHLVMLGTSTGHVYLWSDIAQTGTHATELAQWNGSTSTTSWFKSYLTVGANWFLTGTHAAGGEVLMWRIPESSTATSVGFTTVAAT